MDPTLAATWGVLFRQVILIAAGSGATWAVQKGMLSQDNANSLVNPFVAFSISALTGIGAIVWGWWARTKGKLADMLLRTPAGRQIAADILAKSDDGRSKLIAATATLPEIASIQATPEVATAQPSPKVVPATTIVQPLGGA